MSMDKKIVFATLAGILGAIAIKIGIDSRQTKNIKRSINDCKKDSIFADVHTEESGDSGKFDDAGFDRYGFNREGRNKDGYDRKGFDSEGFDKHGFAIDGFNRNGFDRQGYGRDGYNELGIDRVGKDRNFYTERLNQLQNTLNGVFSQITCKQYGYAVYDSRRVLEEIIEQYIKHFLGETALEDTLAGNMDICCKRSLIGTETIKKLHSVRNMCNEDPHNFDARQNLTSNDAWFISMQVKELLETAEYDFVYNQNNVEVHNGNL